jgi:hypothetical protein
MIDVPLVNWYWIGGLTFTILSLISLAVWFSCFWNPHTGSKNP